MRRIFNKKAACRAIVGQLMALGCAPVMAQDFPMSADRSIKGPQPVVGVNHGVPIIQVVPPSAGGVSHNRFTHFNVGPAGAVLNNSGGSSQTQIAGQISGNPMLGNKHAKIILNQVTAANPSQLQGMLEVAGHRAHVIVANPAGITCNGCGFLNASRATLTTGRPDVGPKGNIAFDVAGGNLKIDGKGLDGTQVGQVDLLARALELNAGVWADRLNIVAGAARVDAATGKAEVIEGVGAKPKFSLDTAAMGGMYANSIRLIGTESGVGVNVGGNLVALTGSLTLTAAGDIRIAPQGTLSAKEKLTVNTAGHLTTQQATLHANDVSVTAQTLRNQKGSITSANSIALRIDKELHNANGLISAAGNHTIKASSLGNVGGTLAGGTLSVDVQMGVDNTKGLILADNAMQLTAGRLLNKETLGESLSSVVATPSQASDSTPSPGKLSTGISAKTLTLRVPDIGNQKGSIQASVDLNVTSDVLNNSSGLIAGQRHTRIEAGKLVNPKGTLSAGQLLATTIKQLDGLGWLQAGTDLHFTYPGSLTPSGNFIAVRDLRLTLGGLLVNKGRLSAGRDLAITADALTNTATGELIGGNHASFVVANSLNNTGLIQASGDLHVTSDTLNNSSGVVAAQHHTHIDAGKLLNRKGTLSAGQLLTTTIKQLDSLGSLQAGSDLHFTYPGSLTPDGNFIAVRDLKLSLGGHLVNKKRLSAGRDLAITADALTNTATGELLGGRHASFVVANSLDNTGLIDGQYTRVDASQIHNRGRIYGNSVTLSANTLNNDAGPKGSAQIASRGNLKLGVNTVNNLNHSVLYAKTNLRLASWIDAAGVPAGQADQVKNIAATIEAGTSVTITARDIQNHNGGFESELVQLSSKPKVYFTPEGSTTMYDGATSWLCDTVTRACSRDPKWINDDPERRFLMPSKKYPESRYGPLFPYAPYKKGYAGVSSPIALAYASSGQGRETIREYFQYSRDSPIWAVFGVAPPSQDLPSRDDHNFLWNQDEQYQRPLSERDAEYESKPAYKEYKQRYLELDKRIRTFNRDFFNRLVKNFTFYEVNEVAKKTKTVRSDPGRILSGGSLTLNGAVTNDKSQIAAAGKLTVDGPAINNIGATGRNIVTREGQATFTQARSRDRQAHRAYYYTVVKDEPFDLPVGPLRSVMTPKVQVPARMSADQDYGTLMAGRHTYINSLGNFINSGTVGAAETMRINALNIVNQLGGKIQANRLYLDARENLNNIAALIQGGTVFLRAGRNINLISTEASSDFLATSGTYLSGSSQVKANDLTLKAGNDIHMFAARVAVERDALLQAGRDIRLDPATLRHSELISSGAHQRHELSTQKVIGSSTNAKRDLAVVAGQDVEAKAAELNAKNRLTVSAERDVNILPGIDSGSATDQYREKKKGFLSFKTESTSVAVSWEQSHASTLTGKNVQILAGGDVTIVGSDIGAEDNLAIEAKGNVNIQPGHSQTQANRVEKTKKSGLGAAGGTSIGKSQKAHAIQEEKTEVTPSTLGALHGNAQITADQVVNVTASTIVAPNGTVEIAANQVNIGAAENTQLKKESLKTKQTGLSVSVNTPMVDLFKSASAQFEKSGKTENEIIKGLAVATAGLEAVKALAVVKAQGEVDGANAADKVGNVRINAQLGSSKQSSKTKTVVSTVTGSKVAAGKDVKIKAKGGKGAKENANIIIAASTVSADHDIEMIADGSISVESGYDTAKTKRDSKGASASIGVGASLGSGGMALGVTASASVQKGKATGKEKTVVNSKVVAGKKVTVKSGGDTKVKGSVIKAETIVAKVGGNLNIESEQDTSSYKSKDTSAGGSVTMGAGASASGNVAMTKVSGDFASVREQSGLQAGDGGFDIDVAGNTNLKGAVISSTDEAVEQGLNTFKTGSLTLSDIENHSKHKADSMALSASYAGEKGSLGPGRSGTSGKESSTTRSGVSDAAITITDHETQRALTGKTAEQLLGKLNVGVRTGDSETGLTKDWDPEKLRSKVAAEAELISAFTLQVGQTISSYTDEKRKALLKQMDEARTENEVDALQKQINTVNMQERLMNVVVGFLTGSGGLYAVHGALSQAADEMRQYSIADSMKFAGITDGETTLDNRSGKSAGIKGSVFKLAGTRANLDILCGKMNEFCVAKKDASGNKILDERGVPILELQPATGMVQFDSKEAKQTLAQRLAGPAGKSLAGFTGGIQGGPGTLGGEPYAVGSTLDLMHEAYAGPHDFIGGTLTGLYDNKGNARQGQTKTEEIVYDVLSAAALVPATPFALSEALPAAAWQTFDMVLGLLR